MIDWSGLTITGIWLFVSNFTLKNSTDGMFPDTISANAISSILNFLSIKNTHDDEDDYDVHTGTTDDGTNIFTGRHCVVAIGVFCIFTSSFWLYKKL